MTYRPRRTLHDQLDGGVGHAHHVLGDAGQHVAVVIAADVHQRQVDGVHVGPVDVGLWGNATSGGVAPAHGEGGRGVVVSSPAHLVSVDGMEAANGPVDLGEWSSCPVAGDGDVVSLHHHKVRSAEVDVRQI